MSHHDFEFLERTPRTERCGLGAFAGDVAGGVIAALISLPYGLAMSSLMGLPPILCLSTSLLTAPVIASLGRNPVLIGGASIVTVPFIGTAARLHGVPGAAAISILTSVFMISFRLLRVGRYVALTPRPVISGFSCGIGATMLISQLSALLGLESAVAQTPSSPAANCSRSPRGSATPTRVILAPS